MNYTSLSIHFMRENLDDAMFYIVVILIGFGIGMVISEFIGVTDMFISWVAGV